MNTTQTIEQSRQAQWTQDYGTTPTSAKLSTKMFWFGSLYLGSLSTLVAIGGGMRLLLTYL